MLVNGPPIVSTGDLISEQNSLRVATGKNPLIYRTIVYD